MAETYKKIFIDGQTGEQRIEEFTPEEVAQKESEKENATVKAEAFQAKLQKQEDLKASAKQKLINGEPLTEEEADTIVL